MNTWEYLVIGKKGKVLRSEQLSDYGAQGWELVQVIEAYRTLTGEAESPVRYFIFKRPV